MFLFLNILKKNDIIIVSMLISKILSFFKIFDKIFHFFIIKFNNISFTYQFIINIIVCLMLMYKIVISLTSNKIILCLLFF